MRSPLQNEISSTDLVTTVKWGTYLFFFIVNACFLPIIYFFYPETKQRSLEEIDIIFAKGYAEKISYVKAAKELPFLNDREVENMAVKYGLLDESETLPASKQNSISLAERGKAEEKDFNVEKSVDDQSS